MTHPHPLHRCADCQRNTTTGTWCGHGHRYRRGRTKIKCAAFRDEYKKHSFGTMYDPDTLTGLVIYDRCGAEPLIPWALGHGLDEAARLFRIWLEDECAAYLQHQRDARMKADIDQAARGVRASFRVVRPEDREP